MQGIGSKIKKVRELRNLTQEKVAKKIAMTQAGYSKIEQGAVDIPYSRLEQIAKVLNVKIEDIIAFDEKTMITNQLNNHANITNSYIFSDKNFMEILQKQYESRLEAQQKEIDRLYHLLEKALSR